MIHLNVAFLVIRSTFKNIDKILINASPHAVNKYTNNGLFRACIATIWRMECNVQTVNEIDIRISKIRASEHLNIYNPQR